MHFPNPFAQPGSWYKGNLHVHSTVSDGDLTPEEVCDWYRARGYDFVAFTDHRIVSGRRTCDNGLLALSGIEVDGVDRSSGMYHLVGLGLDGLPSLGYKDNVLLQDAIDSLRAAGAQVVLAHPYWSGQMSRDLLEVEGAFALEIYNGGCEVDDGRGYSTVHWDDLLAAGQRLWGVAVDDAHWRNGDKDAGLGWVWVKAQALTQEAVLGALEDGLFYASSGPQIYDLQYDAVQREVHVRCSLATHIDFVGNGRLSRRVSDPQGRRLTEAHYQLRMGQRYVRVACHDARGGWAWSNPIFV